MFINRWGRTLLYGGSFFGTCAGLYVLFDDSMKLKTFEKEKVLHERGDPGEKVYLVTGANTGIGCALAWELAALQHKVFLLCRDMKKCEKTRETIVLDTKNKFVYCRPCDLSSQASIRSFVKEFKELNLPGIDGLCNNAGVMELKSRSTTAEGIESQFGVNHMGHYLLTRLLEDPIKARKGRIVYLLNMNYRLGSIDFSDINFQGPTRAYDPITAHKQSQLANAMFIHEYSRLMGDSISIFGAYPGLCNTGIKRHMSLEESLVGKYISGPFLRLFGRQASEGAQTPLKLLVDLGLEGQSGKIFTDLEEVPLSSNAKEEGLNKRLLLMDDYWTGLLSGEDLAKRNARVQK